MRYLFILVFITLNLVLKAQTYTASEIYVHIFSPAPITDIEAITNAAQAKLNLSKKEVEIHIPINTFTFKKALMQTHFNEKYIESDKYPEASYKGRFKESIDLNTDGVYTVNFEGKFSIHGVEKSKTITSIITVKDHKIYFESNFLLLSADFRIKAPDVIYRKVGQEVTVDINGFLKKETQAN